MAAIAGLDLDDWQKWVLGEALSETSAHRWSAFEVALVVPRQNGKGTVLEARQLAGLFVVHERLQIHTAHEFKTCYEHFLRVKNLIESCPDLDARVQRIRTGAGDQAIELKTGERLRFVARSSASGKGFSGDVVYLDEAFALTAPMMGALLPTLSSRPDPQVWYTSSSPYSYSSVLHGVRRRGVAKGSSRLFFAEWSNDPGVDPEDRGAWYRANPALGIRISEEFVAAELDAMRSVPEEFVRERLGVPEPEPVGDERAVKIPAGPWGKSANGLKPSMGVGSVTVAFGVSRDGEWSSIAVGGGSLAAPYVELIDHRQGVGWLPGRLVELAATYGCVEIGCNGAGAAAAQVGPVALALAEARLATVVRQLGSAEWKAACGGLLTDVIEGRLCRPSPDVLQSPLDRAAGDAAERPLGDAFAWAQRNVTIPLAPLEAVTAARALLPQTTAAPVPTVSDLSEFYDEED